MNNCAEQRYSPEYSSPTLSSATAEIFNLMNFLDPVVFGDLPSLHKKFENLSKVSCDCMHAQELKPVCRISFTSYKRC